MIRRPLGWAVAIATTLVIGCGGEPYGRGTPRTETLPAAAVEARADRLQRGVPEGAGKQILFGDLHVHTTFSPDAFVIGMPIMGGEGARPPADACDFARFCSQLDFWSINDHAEGITPRRWRETKAAIRECNANADPAAPDTVAFLGWEWSQVARTPEEHWGHKNVIFRETADAEVPTRAIAAPRAQLGRSPIGNAARLGLVAADWANRDFYLRMPGYYEEIADTPVCDAGVDVRALPEECLEIAPDPATLFEKLDQWGFDSIVIPHGNAWGLNTPPGTRFDKQLDRRQHDPERQILFELYSGHGSSEEVRSWRAVRETAGGGLECPEPSDDFLPCCWRAGQLIRARCEDPSSADCEARVVQARQHYVEAGVTGHWTVPGVKTEEWLECGQCTDCFNPAFDLRPAATGQYAMTLAGADGGRFHFGFIGSSDNHEARPGTGYKEFARLAMTEATGPRDGSLVARLGADDREPGPASMAFDPERSELGLNRLRDMDRQSAFFMTGGLVAAHAAGRDRGAIWDALKAREVYATSGDRILLWFDALRSDGVRAPMGSALPLDETPRFRVSAAGAFEQRPGCPESVEALLGSEDLARICLGECYHPSDRRRRITRIEVVRIRRQDRPGEPVHTLVDDPWRVFPCPNDPSGCSVDFEDPEALGLARDLVYYARAIQEPTLAVNADPLRCERDAAGVCVEARPCYGDYRTPADEDCLAPNEERAWSSPIVFSAE